MTLTLTIANVDRLDDGSPVTFVIDRRDALIGRSPTCDWSLPDPRQFISSRHCQVSFRDGAYTLSDVSTNGTLLNGAAQRMSGPRRIEAGDRFQVGQYEIVAALTGGSAVVPPPVSGGWGSTPSAGSGWDLPPRAQPASSGWDLPPASANAGWPAAAAAGTAGTADWGTPPALPADAPPPWPLAHDPASAINVPPPFAPPSAPAAVADDWPPLPQASAASPWNPAQPAPAWPGTPPEPPAPAPVDDPWGKLTDGNTVDWTRGGFSVVAPEERLAAPAPAWPPVAPSPAAMPDATSAWPYAAPNSVAPPTSLRDDIPTTPPGPLPPVEADPAAIVEAFAAAAGLKPGQLKSQGTDVLENAGALLRQLVAGLVVMVEARARAKSQMGAEATSLNFQGNNPIKFARTPEQALAQLLNPKERGFMDAAPAIEDAFHDLQSHQMATLKAMQGALRATLDRFSPTAIRARAESKGLLGRIMPGAREAALWQAYEREFSGVAQGSDEAFMDVFANEFRKAYEELAKARR